MSTSITLATVLGSGVLAHLTSRLQGGDASAREPLVELAKLLDTLQQFWYPLTLVIAICFLWWFYRAHRNLASFRTPPLEYSHGATGLGFVVPIASLILPLWVMQEVWRGSEPSLPRGESIPFEVPKSGVAEAWWATYVAKSIVGILAAISSRNIHGLPDILTYSYWLLGLSALSTIAGVLCIVLVVQVTKRQGLCARLAPVPLPLPLSPGGGSASDTAAGGAPAAAE